MKYIIIVITGAVLIIGFTSIAISQDFNTAPFLKDLEDSETIDEQPEETSPKPSLSPSKSLARVTEKEAIPALW